MAVVPVPVPFLPPAAQKVFRREARKALRKERQRWQRQHMPKPPPKPRTAWERIGEDF